MACLVALRHRLRRCAGWRAPCRRWSPSALIQGLGAGALQPTEQAILRQTFPPKEQGMAMALFGMAVDARPGVRPHARRLHRRQLQLAVDLLHQPPGRRARLSSWCSASSTSRRTSAPPTTAAAEKQRKQHGLGGHRAALRWALATLQYVLEEGNRNDWFDSRLITVLAFVAAFAHRGVRHPRADRAGAGGEPARSSRTRSSPRARWSARSCSRC